MRNEGKSFHSANYSLALAQQGYRVLLIDGDLRRPNMHRIFRFPEAMKKNNSAEEDSAPGVMDCLVGEADLTSAARLIPAGAIDIVSDNVAVSVHIYNPSGGPASSLSNAQRAATN